MSISSEQRQLMTDIQSLAISAQPVLNTMTGMSANGLYVFHDVSVYRGNECLYRSTAMIGPDGYVDSYKTLTEQRDELTDLIIASRKEAA